MVEGHQVDVIAAGDGRTPDDQGRGFTVTRLPAGDRLFYGAGAPETLEGGGATWLAAGQFLAAMCSAVRARAGGWDLIESHWLVPSALAASAAAAHLPRRAWAHSGDVALLERMPLGRSIARRLAGDGTDLRFVSAALRDRFAALAGVALGQIDPLPVAPHLFGPRGAPDPALRQRFGLVGPTVLAVGRLVPIKGHARLLHAAALAADGHAQPIEVVILGDGPERPRLLALAAELSVRLRLPGFVDRAQVAAWLRAADLFVLPSLVLPNGRTEGAPTSLREAVAVGVPTSASAHPAQIARAIRQLRLT